MSANIWEVEDGGGKARKAAHVYFVGGKPGGDVDGVVIGALDVRELWVPMFLFYHGEHEGHRVIDALDTTVGAAMVGACGNFVDA